MINILRVLEHLSYVVECAATDLMGEAKTELENLADFMEEKPDYSIENGRQIAAKLRKALAFYRKSGRREGSCILGSVSRDLWKRIV